MSSKNDVDYPVGVKIIDIIEDSHDVKTFIVDKEMNAKPGQFVMVWVPRVDEKTIYCDAEWQPSWIQREKERKGNASHA